MVEFHGFHDCVIKLADLHLLPGGEVIGAVPLAVGRVDNHLREIARIAEIASGRSHEAFLALREPAKEDRERTRDIARPDDVGEPKGDPVDARELYVILSRGF